MQTHLQALNVLPQNHAVQRLVSDHIDLVVMVLLVVIVIITIIVIVIVDASDALRQTAACRQPPLGRDQLFATQPTLWTIKDESDVRNFDS